MKKSKNRETADAETINKKLEAIIEKSKVENEALRKILRGLEKTTEKKDIKKQQ